MSPRFASTRKASRELRSTPNASPKPLTSVTRYPTFSVTSNLFEVKRFDKTLYNYIEVSNAAARDFARDCEADDAVKFFFKLPAGFDIPTSLGTYQPGWAVILENDAREIFIADTKNALDQQLPQIERLKIGCAEKYFAALGISYRFAANVEDLARQAKIGGAAF